jgi:hypothetical protein
MERKKSWEMLTARDLVATVKGPRSSGTQQQQQQMEEREQQEYQEDSSRKLSRWTGSCEEQAEVRECTCMLMLSSILQYRYRY